MYHQCRLADSAAMNVVAAATDELDHVKEIMKAWVAKRKVMNSDY